MAKFSSIYKQTAPTRRVVQGENTFEKGMYWTESVIEQGYVHTLLNFEIDQLSFIVQVTGGLHTTDVAAGCTYLDKYTFGSENDANIIVLQSRNEYNLRAFEGITNIISANKLTIKNNQTLEEKLRQQGFTADDVVCYKLLTYNPVNHRLMSVTLIQAKRDKYFVIDGKHQLRRLNSNPISCGFSEIWKTTDNTDYVTNRLNYHTRGKDDYYVPRARRNNYNETFGQTLHSPLYMQTVPNCEGYGNKTFCFTKKKLIDLEGPIKTITVPTSINATEITNTVWSGGADFNVGDIIVIQASDNTKTIRQHRVLVEAVTSQDSITTVRSGNITVGSSYVLRGSGTADVNLTYWFSNPGLGLNATHFSFYNTVNQRFSLSEFTEIGRELSLNSPWFFDNSYVKLTCIDAINHLYHIEWNILNDRFFNLGLASDYQQHLEGVPSQLSIQTTGIFSGISSDYSYYNSFEISFIYSGSTAPSLVNHSVNYNLRNIQIQVDANASQEIYLRQINTGVSVNYSAILNNEPVPLDAFRFGIVLTGCALIPSDQTISTDDPITPIAVNDLWDKALVEEIQSNNTESLFKLDLTDGTLAPTEYAMSLQTKKDLAFVALPYLDRDIVGMPDSLVVPGDLFKITNGASITAWGSNSATIHPADFLKDDIKFALRKGQGFRFAAYCTSMKNPNRYLNTIREDPLNSKYYNEEVTAVFVLDYVWNGSTWEFSFIDTSIDMYDTSNQVLPLVENWELDGHDEFNNIIVRHYIWTNSLAYTSVLTELNINNMAKHVVDDYSALKLIYNSAQELLYTGSTIGLKQDLNTTIEEGFENISISNKSKFADISYGHFEIKPRELTVSEAALWGYNMLSTTPYTFECADAPSTSTAHINGVMRKDVNDTSKVLLKPMINTPCILEFYFTSDMAYFASTTNTKYFQFTIEFKNPYDEWRVLKKFSIDETHEIFAQNTPLQIPFTGTDALTTIRWTLTDTNPANAIEVPSDVTSVDQEMITEYLIADQNLAQLEYATDSNKVQPDPENYDLGSATGMTYWKGRLVVWGVLNAENILFMSEPDRPEYFAYGGSANDIDIFEENIVHAIPYSDALIVFTSTKLWRLDIGVDGLSWTKSLLQQNLRIVDSDIPYITVLKNMLFFKSDKQFYMLVPSKSSTVGELTIAPISNAIKGFLVDPFAAIRSMVKMPYPDLAGKKYTPPSSGSRIGSDGDLIDVPELPITDYLIKYGVHTEQNRVMVDWWFDLTDWKNQVPHYSDHIVHHDVIPGATVNDSATYLEKEYWLVQLVYDAQTYSWTIRTHTTNSVGVFIADAVNADTDFISLLFCPKPLSGANAGIDIFNNNAKATWGLEISHRRKPADRLLKTFALTEGQTEQLIPSYPRLQIFDTGYKETSSPALKKRFRELQLSFKPDPETEEGLNAAYIAMLDGNTIMSAVEQDVIQEQHTDPSTGDSYLIVKVVDSFKFFEDSLTDDALSNTFMLNSSALTGVSYVKIRKQFNGKGYLARARFVNLTHASYSLTNYAFVLHNKNTK